MADEARLNEDGLTWAGLVEEVGFDAAVRLAEAFGGTPLYIPRNPKPDQKIARAVGMEVARKLAARWGGDAHDIPMAKSARRAPIITAVAQGRLKKMEAARILGMSLRQVRRLVNEDEDSEQGTLF